MEKIKNFYKNKKVLVTGGAGFIGSHLVEKLVNLGARVTIFDNFSSGKLSNLHSVITNINILYSDVTSSYSCKKAIKDQQIIFHLAAFVSVPGSVKNPALCYSTNINGTKHLLQACIDINPTAHIIYSSSSSIYGNKENKCNESDCPSPTSPYARSKLEGERICNLSFNQHGLKTTILRYFNVHGERQNPNGPYAGVVAKFTQNLCKKDPITVYGNGLQTRDFISVSKVVISNLIMPLSKETIGNTYNIATGKSINLLELIKQLEKQLDKKSVKILFEPKRSQDILSSQASCLKLNSLINKLNIDCF